MIYLRKQNIWVLLVLKEKKQVGLWRSNRKREKERYIARGDGASIGW